MKNSVLSICGSLLLLLPLPLSLHAGFIKEWQLKESASAPVVVAGRILSVHRSERVPENQLSWKAETWSMTADVEVLRSFTASGIPLGSHQIQVHFLAYGPSVTMFVNGYPPALPDIKSGEIRILPLRENTTPASEPWQLMADSGVNITIPVRADAKIEPAPPPSARAFLIREFANTLSRGTPGEVASLSSYLSRQWEDLSGELMPLLEALISDNRQQWAEIATSLHAARGTFTGFPDLRGSCSNSLGNCRCGRTCGTPVGHRTVVDWSTNSTSPKGTCSWPSWEANVSSEVRSSRSHSSTQSPIPSQKTPQRTKTRHFGY
jgi:hypothetical protein